MACDCSGFETEHSAFGKKFKGVSGGIRDPEKVPWRAMVDEGEKCLCKCQDVLVDLWERVDDSGISVPLSLKRRVFEQMEMLADHKDSEGQNSSRVRSFLEGGN